MDTWLNAQIGVDAASVISHIAICITLFAIAWLCLAFFRRLNKRVFPIAGRKGHTRLSVCDIAIIDSQRRVILIRRDNIEHLVLIGGSSDMIIEGNIEVSEVKPHTTKSVSLPSVAAEKPVITAKSSPRAEETITMPVEPIFTKQEKEQYPLASEPSETFIHTVNASVVSQMAGVQQQIPLPQALPSRENHTLEVFSPAINVEATQSIKHVLPKDSVPLLEVNRKPIVAPAQFQKNTSFYSQREIEQKQLVDQPLANQASLDQEQPVSVSSRSRESYTAITPKIPSAFYIRQNAITPRPMTSAPCADSTNSYTSSYLNNLNQQTIEKNTVSGTLTSDYAISYNTHKEYASQVRQETDLRATSQPAKEDFEGILSKSYSNPN
ncbi:MAG: hypothetical protein JSC189_001266 [Candidatus Tokpelaia sp. JSC189]|nr:MAG: hypothetical protein JSC189_001266 [Candidatus Tokpelaia sp. JSC189]